jgi:hypothetical protein
VIRKCSEVIRSVLRTRTVPGPRAARLRPQ